MFLKKSELQTPGIIFLEMRLTVHAPRHAQVWFSVAFPSLLELYRSGVTCMASFCKEVSEVAITLGSLPKINDKAGAQIAFPWGTYLHFHGPEGSVRPLETRVFAPLQLRVYNYYQNILAKRI